MVLRRQDTMLCNLGSMRFQSGRKRYSSPQQGIDQIGILWVLSTVYINGEEA